MELSNWHRGLRTARLFPTLIHNKRDPARTACSNMDWCRRLPDAHCERCGIASLEERGIYCSKRLAVYPLILSDDTDQTVYHITCALDLASHLLADMFTFFNPPAPYPPLFVLTSPDAASATMACGERAQTKGDIHAFNQHSSD